MLRVAIDHIIPEEEGMTRLAELVQQAELSDQTYVLMRNNKPVIALVPVGHLEEDFAAVPHEEIQQFGALQTTTPTRAEVALQQLLEDTPPATDESTPTPSEPQPESTPATGGLPPFPAS